SRSILAVPNFSALVGAEGKITSHSWHCGYSRSRVMRSVSTGILEALNCQVVARSCSRRCELIHKAQFAEFDQIAFKSRTRMLRDVAVLSQVQIPNAINRLTMIQEHAWGA